MAKKDVEQERVQVSVAPPPESAIKQVDEVFIVVTQAYCQNGHNLVIEDGELFDGYPGLRLNLTSRDGVTGTVTLSPFHGDNTKKGDLDWKNGEPLVLSCPVCNEELPRLASCNCEGKGNLVKVHLTPGLSDSHILAMCNVWGCRRSRTIDNWQIISEYLDGTIKD
jgi:hypothetical protein